MMGTTESPPLLADPAVSAVPGGAAYVAEIERRLAPCCERAEPRQRAMAYLRGLLRPAARQHRGQLAEVCGDVTPDGVQPWLRRALWHPEAVLVIDETGVRNKGRHSAGGVRQSSGTAGRIEHCPIGGLLAYASRLGPALLDWELSGPEAWTGARARGRQAGVPEDRWFATTPQLAQAMRHRTLAAGGPARWGTGDSVDGDDRRLRLWLEAQPHASVLAVSGQEDVWLGWRQRHVKTLLAALPADGWTRLRAGDGAKGPRGYDWRWLPRAEPLEPSWCRWLLVRRRVSEPTERRASGGFAPQESTLAEVVRGAGSRWTMEQLFDAAQGEVGLDQYEVRSWTGWYRHRTRAM